MTADMLHDCGVEGPNPPIQDGRTGVPLVWARNRAARFLEIEYIVGTEGYDTDLPAARSSMDMDAIGWA
jgi:hypothetical protein